MTTATYWPIAPALALAACATHPPSATRNASADAEHGAVSSTPIVDVEPAPSAGSEASLSSPTAGARTGECYSVDDTPEWRAIVRFQGHRYPGDDMFCNGRAPCKVADGVFFDAASRSRRVLRVLTVDADCGNVEYWFVDTEHGRLNSVSLLAVAGGRCLFNGPEYGSFRDADTFVWHEPPHGPPPLYPARDHEIRLRPQPHVVNPSDLGKTCEGSRPVVRGVEW